LSAKPEDPLRSTVIGIFFMLVAALPYVGMLWTRGDSAVVAPPASGAPRLTLLSPHRREVRLEYSRAFTSWMRERHTQDIEVVWLDVGGTSKILKELESRFAASPESSGVDLLFGGGIDPYIGAARQNWLLPLAPPPAAAAGIPATVAGSPVFDSQGRWYGIALSGFGILFNKPLLERLGLPAPRDWDDLGRPDYYSWVGSGDPRSSGAVHMCYEIILQAYGFEAGWSLITRICANVRSFGESAGTVPREVAAGDIAAGMAIDQYAQTVIGAVGGGRLAFILPPAHTIVNPDAIGVLRGAPNEAAARLFVEFALSPEGQRILFQPAGTDGQRYTLYRNPVRPELFAEPGAPAANPYLMPAAMTYDSELGSRRWGVYNDLMGVWLIDAHQGLRQAWKQVIDRGAKPEDVARLCAPPVTEAELNALVAAWKDPRRRQDTMRDWARQADARYRSLSQEEPQP
jgi:ABC-type Fe3+ transport system substrate-binding protein